MFKSKKILAAISLTGLLLIPTTTVMAQQTSTSNAKAAVCQGVNLSQGGTGAQNDCSDQGAGATGIIKLAVNILSLIVGVAAIIMIIIGGLKYVTSQGEASNTAGAKNTIMYAIIGLVIVAFAQLIVRFTLNRAADLQCTAGQHLLANGTCGL